MHRFVVFLVAIFLSALTLASTANAKIIGVYLRNSEQLILVRTDQGKLFCTRVGDGFEMCGGLAENTDGFWSGNEMKHPDMPSFMTFIGTVKFDAEQIYLDGCALGKSRCESEVWSKME